MASKRLTYGEQLMLHRRAIGRTQGDAAKGAGMSLQAYRAEEERDDFKAFPTPIKWSQLEGPEQCLIQRRRVGITQDELAVDIGVSRVWLNQMERGIAPCDRLVEYWDAT